MNDWTKVISEEHLLQQVSPNHLMSHLQMICQEVRLSGSEEELRAFHYVQRKLEEYKIPTQLSFHKAYISLPIQSELCVADTPFPSITHSMGVSVNRLQAEIVYAGAGSQQDYQGLPVVGKIVLLDGLATPAAVKNAEEHGAIGAVFINAKHTHEMIVSTVWGTPTFANKDLLPSIPVVSVTSDNGERIRSLLAKGLNQCMITTEVDTRIRSIPTLIADIQGQEEPEKFVLFSGHIDSWHYGAMDNGSANAVMLEIARILGNQRQLLRRSLRLAFWSGHSHGRYAGSAWYCDTHWEDLHENCLLHINIDSVGAVGATVLTEANAMKETQRLAQEVISQLTEQNFVGSRFGRSGDQSFWGPGIPSLFMGLSEQEPSNDPTSMAFGQLFGSGNSGGFGWWWHTTEDTIDKIDPTFLERDCKIYLSIIFRSLNEPIYPLDQLAAIEEIEQAVRDWQRLAGEHFDLSVTLKRIADVASAIRRLDERIVAGPNETECIIINRCLLQLSRYLVPINYVKGSVFDHDLALNQPPVPKLSDIEQLVRYTPEQPEYYFYQTSLVRSQNELNEMLKKAAILLQDTWRLLENEPGS